LAFSRISHPTLFKNIGDFNVPFPHHAKTKSLPSCPVVRGWESHTTPATPYVNPSYPRLAPVLSGLTLAPTMTY